MKYEDWIQYEEARLAERDLALAKYANGKSKRNGKQSESPQQLLNASYRERCLVEVLLQQQALIDALRAQVASLQSGAAGGV